jgi:hypothetical protein
MLTNRRGVSYTPYVEDILTIWAYAIRNKQNIPKTHNL